MSRSLKKGDVVSIDLNPTVGHEQNGHRPALIISTAEFHAACGFALIVPITSTQRGSAFEVEVNVPGKVKGWALSNQLRSVDLTARGAKLIATVPKRVGEEVANILKAIIDGK